MGGQHPRRTVINGHGGEGSAHLVVCLEVLTVSPDAAGGEFSTMSSLSQWMPQHELAPPSVRFYVGQMAKPLTWIVCRPLSENQLTELDHYLSIQARLG